MGYQLSMGITAYLVLMSDRQTNAMIRSHAAGLQSSGRSRLMQAIGLRLWNLLKINIACWAVAMPIIAYHTGVVGLLAPIATIVLTPLIAATMALGYTQMSLGMLHLPLAGLLDGVTAQSIEIMLFITTWFETWSFSWIRVHRIELWWACAVTTLLSLLATRTWSPDRLPAVVCSLLLTVMFFLSPRLHQPRSSARVVMLDVGDGSCFVIQSGASAILWDCGSLDRRVGTMTARALRTMGVRSIDLVVVTHDNIDHYNGLPTLAEHMPIARVAITARLEQAPSPSWERVRADLERKGATFETTGRGAMYTVGELHAECLWPNHSDDQHLDDNDTSCVLLIGSSRSPGGPAILLTGDIEKDAMHQLRLLEPLLPQRLRNGAVELPHHGSARDAAYPFMDWLDAGVVLQSTGPSRMDDERWIDQRHGRAWYTSSSQGAAWVSLEQDGSIRHGWWFE